MADYFRKTERGRREVRERSVNLPRAARNLLLILDSSKTLGSWVGMINGATLADGVALLEAGLIEAQPGPGGPETRPAAFFEPTEPAGLDAWPPSAASTLPAPLGANNLHRSVISTRPGALPATFANTGAPASAGLTPVSVPPVGASAAAKAPPARAFENVPEAPADSVLPEKLSSFAPLDASNLPAGSTGLGYTELYDSLNALMRETLGLFRGYRYTLRIERAQNIAELEVVAREFIAEVKRVRGESMARMVQRALGLGG
jgi:hypothetical protein